VDSAEGEHPFGNGTSAPFAGTRQAAQSDRLIRRPGSNLHQFASPEAAGKRGKRSQAPQGRLYFGGTRDARRHRRESLQRSGVDARAVDANPTGSSGIAEGDESESRGDLRIAGEVRPRSDQARRAE